MACTFEFPKDLLDAQSDLRRIEQELGALYKRLPWSVEPLAGWDRSETGHYFASSRPDSPGWKVEEEDQVQALRDSRLKIATAIMCHEYWATCKGAPAGRSALKHAHE